MCTCSSSWPSSWFREGRRKLQAIRLGRLTALRKPDGGVRGIVVGDVVRRLASRTVAQQLGEAVKLATSPFQFALSKRGGCECISHALQASTEASDVSPSAVPFVRKFCGSPSRYLWEDDSGEVHDIDQGEGGEQGDPLMPMLFSLGQHNALRVVQARLQEGELIFAYLDDVYIICSPERVSAIYAILQEELWRRGYESIMGRRKCGTCLATAPVGCDVLDPEFTTVWRGGGEPAHQGIMILGTPLGHPMSSPLGIVVALCQCSSELCSSRDSARFGQTFRRSS